MQLGQLKEIGDTAQVFDNPQDDYTKRLLQAIPGDLMKACSDT